MPVQEQGLNFNSILDELSSGLSGKAFYCILVEDSDEGNSYEKKAVVRNGAANWQDIIPEDIKHLEASSDFLYGDNEPQAEYIGFLFGK